MVWGPVRVVHHMLAPRAPPPPQAFHFIAYLPVGCAAARGTAGCCAVLCSAARRVLACVLLPLVLLPLAPTTSRRALLTPPHLCPPCCTSFRGCLYELDGLKPGPIKLADCTDVRRLPPAGQRRGYCGAARLPFQLQLVCCWPPVVTSPPTTSCVRLPPPWLWPQEDWLPKAAAAITERMGRYAASEVKVRAA